MHCWLSDRLGELDHHRGRKVNLLAPRGAAKSTLATLAYPLRCALENREPYIWIVSDTRLQARTHLDNIREELLDNEQLRANYPDAADAKKSNAASIVLPNGAAIDAIGSGQRIRGRRRRANRPTLIISDDLQNDTHITSVLLRDRSRSWFHGTLLKAGTPRTNVLNLATALHRDAVALELHRTPGWTSGLFQAIEEWPTDLELWAQWEAIYTDLATPDSTDRARQFYDEHQAAMDAGAKILWPEMESLYNLMCLRIEGGRTTFEREKQNRPVNPDQCEWPEDYFDPRKIHFDRWPAQPTCKVLSLDPSKGADSRRSDYSAFIQLAIDTTGILYVDADLARRPTPELVDRAAQLYQDWQPDGFCVEANQYQDLLGGLIASAFAARRLLAPSPYLVNNTVPKQVRIRRLGPYLAQGRLRFRAGSPGVKILLDQLKDFPTGDHDDGPDALEMAIRLAAQLVRPMQPDRLGNRLKISA